MKNQKIYEAHDKMITLIKDNYNLLQSLCSFGINLGFGDKTVSEICADNGVDTHTFLTIVNFTINGCRDVVPHEQLSVPTLLHYLESSHVYFLGFQLPFIRREIEEAIGDTDGGVGLLILRFYDEYAREIRKHMLHEERVVFPYVKALLNGKADGSYSINTFASNHVQADNKLKELKTLIIKYLPSDAGHNNKMIAALHDVFNNEEWLHLHREVEERIFVPAIRRLEATISQSNVAKNISEMVMRADDDSGEQLSERERDVVVALVQGMSNKEIANHLFISTNTVITHRRNIARKLQIHSEAGLTIYAIVNGLVDISAVKLKGYNKH
ncbi:MAG: LuxR C-terminal-related transcriptional regulator [Muribaculaceae bacterium]